ncbi:LysR family transcriptional regulator [Streptomyces sp. NPDC059679]|uniref:LysR family transcriptional regulator n=1 Tax=Streptomyces sp. NPDC059679 TaxID=3346903 RepID=UPI0036B33BDC
MLAQSYAEHPDYRGSCLRSAFAVTLCIGGVMELNSLRQFLVVARLQHLSRAAEEFHIAQPSLRRTIARLESELGAPLFDRSKRLRLNDAGRLFRDHVERALGELDAGRRAVAEATSGGLGTVRLASETFLTLTGPLADYKQAHPAVEIELHWSPPEDWLVACAPKRSICVSPRSRFMPRAWRRCDCSTRRSGRVCHSITRWRAACR